MDSDTGGKPKHDFSDIMSILGDEKKPEPAPKKHESPKPRDDTFIKKLLSDIEQKNAEILKLNSDNMALKYSMSDKEMEIKRLQGQSDSLRERAESLKAQVVSLNQQIEDLNRFVNDARVKLGEMDSDRAKLTARIVKEEEAPPEEEDVASIFKRIALDGKPEETSGDGADKPKPQKKIGTAKLYDL